MQGNINNNHSMKRGKIISPKKRLHALRTSRGEETKKSGLLHGVIVLIILLSWAVIGFINSIHIFLNASIQMGST